MTMRPGAPADPPQAAAAPTDPADEALATVEQAVEAGREHIADARQQALDAAQSDAERAAINARFDAMGEQFSEFTSRIEAAISAGNDRLVETLTGAIAAMQAAGQGNTSDDGGDVDGEILSVEEIAEGAADVATEGAAAVGDAAGAVADAAVQAVDEAPRRAHALFRPLWGGNK